MATSRRMPHRTGQGKVGKIADAAVVLLVRLGMQIGQERFLALSKSTGRQDTGDG